MQHIESVRIAALADEPATLVERAHLAECALCNAELASAQRIVRMAMTDTPAIERPISSWERLGPALRAEGLVKIPMTSGEYRAGVTPIAARQKSNVRWMMQAAAGVLLAVGGAVVGRASVAMPGEAPASQVATAVSDTSPSFASTEEAMRVAQHYSDEYQRAVEYIAAHDSTVTMRGRDAAALLSARLDAIDQSVAATTAALTRSPQDPVLNNLYRQIGGVRSATLRQMGQVVPVSSTSRVRF